MKLYLLPCLFIFLCISFLNSSGQDTPEPKQESDPAWNSFYAGGQASTNGLGFNIKYILSRRITFSAGMETMHIVRNFEVQGYGVPFNTQVDYKTGGLFLLGELFYTRSLYLSAGIIANNFQPHAEGRALTSIRYGDIDLQPSTIGTLSVDVEPKYRYSPYAGVGIRRFFDKNHIVSCNFETGLFYLGTPQMHLEATGLLQPTANPANGKEEYLEAQFSNYKYYPVVKAGIGVRIF